MSETNPDITMEALAAQVATLTEENRRLAGAVDALARTVTEKSAELTKATEQSKPTGERSWCELSFEEQTSYVRANGHDAAVELIERDRETA